MHKKILILLILLIPVAATAQKAKPKNDSNYDERLLHFGFSMGLNTMDFNVKMDPSDPNNYTAEVVSLKPGINIQIVMDYRPATYFDVRFLPGVSFGQRNLNFYGEDGVLVNEQQIESSFLEFPLLVKAKGMRLNNSRPYLIGGINFRYDLAAKKEYDEDSEVYMRLRKADLYYEVGAGIDFYLPYFKLTIEAKMSNGLRDVLVHDDPHPYNPQYVNSIESLKSQMWVLSFHFE